MEIDKTTISDLSIFSNDDEFSLFDKLDFTRTSRGKEQLKKNFSVPLRNISDIREIQQVLQQIISGISSWPSGITNGTIMVLERFFDTPLDPLPPHVTSVTAYSYKILHGPDFSLAKYSVGHALDFIHGIRVLIEYFPEEKNSVPLKKILLKAKKIIDIPQFSAVENKKASDLPIAEQLQLAYFIRHHYKNSIHELISLYAQLDAWYGMAMAAIKYGLVFPQIIDEAHPFIEANGLYHILLHEPVPYDIVMNRDSNFLFLTGANMAGKSTFIKSVGVAVFLAHIGMAVPAREMKLSVFDGMLSNINVIDNIVKGESYFYNEVQRIKATIIKINDGRKWLILIDELFKGTNVQDAMKCSQAVIEGLLKIRNSLFILSTHLYEIGELLKTNTNISFNYFETIVDGDQLIFNYQLKNGISNDRLGYLILKQEGVVKMLEDL